MGAMGSGVALAIRNKWPIVYEKYKKCHEAWKPRTDLLLGTILPVEIDDKLIVINLFSQVYYGKDGRKYASPEAIGTGLLSVVDIVRLYKKRHGTDYHVYLPRIGCNLGGLDWYKDVCPIVEEIDRLAQDITFYVCDL